MATVQINERVVREGNGTQNITGIVLIVPGVVLMVVGAARDLVTAGRGR